MKKNVKISNDVQKGYVKRTQIYEPNEFLRFLFETADSFGIEHPNIDKEYEFLSIPETLSDITKSVSTEASRILLPKNKEFKYDTKTIAAENSKFAYRYGAMLAGFKSINKIFKQLPKIKTVIYNLISKSKKQNMKKQKMQ